MVQQTGNHVLHGKPHRLQCASGDFQNNWSGYTPPEGQCGLTLLVHNTKNDEVRQYSYVGNMWRYTTMEDSV